MSNVPETLVSLKSCTSTLTALKIEAEDLQSDIPFSLKQQNQLKLNSKIAEFQMENDLVRTKILTEMGQIENLKAEINSFQKRFYLKRNDRSDNQTKANDNASIEIKKLENRIEKYLQEYNQIIADNKACREEVNLIRREKLLLINERENLNEEVLKKREHMNELKERAKHYSTSNSALSKTIAEVKQNSEREKREFREKWNSLKGSLSTFKKDVDFIVEHQGAFEHQPPVIQFPPLLEYKLIHQAKDKLDQYETSIKKLTEKTGINDLSEIINLFNSEESENFSLFNHVSSISIEIEKINLQNTKTRNRIKELQCDIPNSDTNLASKIRELQSKIEKTDEIYSKIDKDDEKTSRKLNVLAIGISEMLSLLNIHPKWQTIDKSNMMDSFELIETELTNYINQFPYKVETHNIPRIEVEVPALVDAFDENEPHIPLSTDEIRYNSLRKLNSHNPKFS